MLNIVVSKNAFHVSGFKNVHSFSLVGGFVLVFTAAFLKVLCKRVASTIFQKVRVSSASSSAEARSTNQGTFLQKYSRVLGRSKFWYNKAVKLTAIPSLVYVAVATLPQHNQLHCRSLPRRYVLHRPKH